MNQVAFFVVGRFLEETARAESFLGLGVLLAFLVKTLLFLGFDDQRRHRNGSNEQYQSQALHNKGLAKEK